MGGFSSARGQVERCLIPPSPPHITTTPHAHGPRPPAVAVAAPHLPHTTYTWTPPSCWGCCRHPPHTYLARPLLPELQPPQPPCWSRSSCCPPLPVLRPQLHGTVVQAVASPPSPHAQSCPRSPSQSGGSACHTWQGGGRARVGGGACHTWQGGRPDRGEGREGVPLGGEGECECVTCVTHAPLTHVPRT